MSDSYRFLGFTVTPLAMLLLAGCATPAADADEEEISDGAGSASTVNAKGSYNDPAAAVQWDTLEASSAIEIARQQRSVTVGDVNGVECFITMGEHANADTIPKGDRVKIATVATETTFDKNGPGEGLWIASVTMTLVDDVKGAKWGARLPPSNYGFRCWRYATRIQPGSTPGAVSYNGSAPNLPVAGEIREALAKGFTVWEKTAQ